MPYRKGKIYQPVSKAQVESDFTNILRNLGYPYAETEVQTKVDTTAKKQVWQCLHIRDQEQDSILCS